MKNGILFLVLAFVNVLQAQVGINTTAPKAQLEIKSSNEATPANTDGLLIPKINAFPATNPTADQQGMLVYLTTIVGANTPGFYYWNNPTTAWLPVKGTDGGTLDQAYDFGGAGNGKTITADAGAVTINGTDGLVSTGTSGSGVLAPSGAGNRMVWNPRKAAFRAGNVSGTQWDDANIGLNSVAFGSSSRAAGTSSTAFGFSTLASGTSSTAFGSGTNASGDTSVAFGQSSSATGPYSFAGGFFSNASGSSSFAFGASSSANGFDSTSFGGSAIGDGTFTTGDANQAVGTLSNTMGRFNTASSYAESVFGIGATTYTPSTNGATQFRAANATDRLFVIGNAIDANNNGSVDTAERSDAMVVLKNGNVGVGISTPQNRLHFHNPTGNQTFIQLTNSSTGTTAGDGMILGNFIATSEAGIINQEASNFYFGTSSNQYQFVLAPNGNVGLSTDSPQDKLHVEGNIRMVDGNQAAGKILTSDANGKASWTTPGTGTAGTLDQSYDFGGAGVGRTITADAGAVTINGTDGLVSTGTLGSGAAPPTGEGVRMVWCPRKYAFRAGRVFGLEWDDANIGLGSVAFGAGTTASNVHSTALGQGTTASGFISTALGANSTASGTQSTAFGTGTTASGSISTAFGAFTIASSPDSTAFGRNTTASGDNSTAFGDGTISSGSHSTAFGRLNTASSFAETVIGIGATTYTPSTNGATQFSAANATDRLFVIGNAIDVNNNSNIDASERSDAMVVLKNGNTGIGVSTPGERLQVAGRTLLTNGFSADNAALLYRNNTDYMFLGPQSGSSSNGAAMALFGSANTSGGNAGGLDVNVPGGQVRMNHTNGSYNFSANSTSGYTGTFELNDSGFEIGNNSASRALIFSPNSTERMRITPTGNVGIGTTVPAQKLHVSGPAGVTAVRIGNTSTVGSSANVALDFFRNTAANTDWRIYNIGPNLTMGNSADDLATVNDLYQFQGARFMPMTDATISLGQGTNRWNTVFASNGTINTSDAREKKNIQNIAYGLKEILQLRPVSFEWKKEDGSGTKLGLIAQELQQVLPEVVRDWDWQEDEQGNRKKVASPVLGVYYSDVIPVLIKAVQEQQQVIEHQKAEIESLKSQLEQQQKAILERLEKLEAKN